ncbi:hypothetical protein KKF84_05540 [Myxococcota bacterium]|nr:hypothetical protein [Myxococcota bacterium]MBU1534761.1 hypothetical protein [Myxococcota bacterium]
MPRADTVSSAPFSHLWRSALLLLNLLLGQGCYATLTAGGYMAETSEGIKPAYGVGLHVGIYLDIDPVRVALGPGAEYVATKTSDSEHSEGMGVRGGSVEASYSLIHRNWWRGRATGVITFDQGYIQGTDDTAICDGECAGRSYFLGGTFDIPLKSGSISASAGPHVMTVKSPDQGTYTAVGAQLRITLSVFLRGAGKIFSGYRYTPPAQPLPRCEMRRNSDGTSKMVCTRG